MNHEWMRERQRCYLGWGKKAIICVSLGAVGSISVHAWWIGDDFLYVDQYCSCSISIEYRFVSGSLRMPSVRSLLLWRLFCSISSCIIVIMYRGGIVRSLVFPLIPSCAGELGIRDTMHSVGLCSLRIVSFHFDILLFRAPVHIFRILLFSYIHLPYARMLGTWSIALSGIAVGIFQLLCSVDAQCVFPSPCTRLFP